MSVTRKIAAEIDWGGVGMVGELQAEDPRSVGPYSLLGRLGGGGMGQVFLGRSRGGRLVAVKVIRPDLAGEPGFRARFAREVAAARNVGGLFTALVIDDDAQGPVPWLATAYVAGPSLAEAVGEHGPLPVASVLTLAAGLAEGLEEIHAAGLVHRDLKPSNVLLAHDGPRVIDFGISRAAEATMLTESGTVMGSPGFMSPEQAAGGTVGPPSDVFSLGAVLAFAATGEGLFGTGSTEALVFRIVHSEPDTAQLPEQIRPVIQRCLAKDPALRPASSDLLAELGAGQLAADWLPVPVADQLSRYEPSTVTGPGARQDQRDAARNGHRPDSPPRMNRRRWTWATATAATLTIAAAIAFLNWPTGLPSVPDVQGDNLTAATSALTAAGFHNIPYLYNCYASDNPGDVVRQAPGAGTHTTRTSPVHLYLQADNCDGVPDVTGMTLPAAATKLKKSGYDNIPYLYSCYGSGNYEDVVQQAPAAGTHTATTSPVHLYLQAKNCHAVPDVIGMSLSNAAAVLKQAGFTDIPYVYKCDGSTDINAVVRQSPAAGTDHSYLQPISLEIQARNC
jgi:serine/threonine protein kinase